MRTSTEATAESGPAGRAPRLERVIEHAGHLLPAQGPISVFVHHNTLHAFEHLPFERAVVEAGELFGCEPFLPEDRYREALYRLRILEHDLGEVVRADLGARASERPGRRTTRAGIRLAMLRHRIDEESGPGLAWLLAETDALSRFREDTPPEAKRRLLYWARTRGRHRGRGAERHALQSLWNACLVAVSGLPPRAPAASEWTRHRDLLLAVTGEDADILVHPPLIRFSAAYLDQGIAFWPLPERESGMHACFLRLHGAAGGSGPSWMAGLGAECEREAADGVSAIESALHSLEDLGVPEEEWSRFVAATLVALRGWAGMVHQFERRPDRAPAHAVPARLADFLAIRLRLERFALRHIARRELGFEDPLAALRADLKARIPAPAARPAVERAYLLFQVSQVLGRTPDDILRLGPQAAAQVLEEMESFPELERRRVFHLAYERRHRVEVLDALAAVVEEPDEPAPAPAFQAVFCIDEREESLRRHLESVEPGCETYGTAGFFNVAMYYRGAADAHPVPLCPIAIRPEHEVHEEIEAAHQREEQRRVRSRRLLGRLAHEARSGSRTLARGTLLTALLGALSAVPLIFRVLLPRLTGRLRRTSGAWLAAPAASRLTLERRTDRPMLGRWLGFTVEEMAGIVRRVLEETGLADRLAPFVLIMGHGSSSLNNPHESAHDCGACGGGRGGPNARAFAQMANHPGVRAMLARDAFMIPEGTLFLGGYHNTCDDGVALYDTAAVPPARRGDLERITSALERARALNAHERCRRFETAPAWLPPALALAHVEARADDLAQVRPEYGHATNAVCFIGRRARICSLFLDRRAFLVSYDPDSDDAGGTILDRILAAVVPVCAGINLEYWFSFVDPVGYGCGTKLPHNITSLVGVMNGSESDLRTGLPWQMVEIHEPVRLLVIVEALPDRLLSALEKNEAVGRLVRNRWIQLVSLSPEGTAIETYTADGFTPHEPESIDLPEVASSADWYGGERDHLAPARVLRATAVAGSG